MEDLEDIDKFLDAYVLRKLNQKDRENINRPITNNEIAVAIKSHPTKKTPGPDGFSSEFYQTLK